MTQTQKKASDPAVSTWLAAHAGTGKTKVLVDRVLRLLLAGEPPSAVLCITYTKAAAVVMQLRIRNQLRRWVRMDEALLRLELQQLLDQEVVRADQLAQARSLLCRMIEDDHGIRVMTIHAFCQSVLARFPIEAGLAPHFQLLDERSAKELLKTARQRMLLRAMHERAAVDLKKAIAYVACRASDHRFEQIMDELLADYLNISAMLRHEHAEKRVLKDIYRRLEIEPDTTLQTLFDRELFYSAEHCVALREACGILSAGGATMKRLGQALAGWLEKGPSLEDFDDYARVFLKTDDNKRAVASFYTSGFAKQYPQLAVSLDHEQERVFTFVQRSKHLEVAQFSAALITIAQGILALYQTLKEEQSWVDYDDLIAFTLGLFAQDGMAAWVMEKMDGQFRHIMLDEAQDTSPLQWLLTHRLVEGFLLGNASEALGRSLFVVGDEKQSIYQFQGAAPEQFWLSNQNYADYFASAGLAFQSLSLDRSFRSTEAVLRVVDSTFAHNGFESGLPDPIRHHVHRTGQAGCVELWPLIRKKEKQSRIAWSDEAPSYLQVGLAQELCQSIVSTIQYWVIGGRMLESKGRPIRASDILILLRKRKPLAPMLIAQLKQAGIPVAGADRLMLNEHLAVQDVLSLARWCLLPSDDLSLAEVLKGPWFSYSEESLYQLAYGRGDRSLWAVLQTKDTTSTALLKDIQKKALHLSPHDWLLYLMDALAGRRRCKERFGEEIDELFDELLNQAMHFESTHIPNLQSFVNWLLSGDSEIKREMDQSVGGVRVMTVHGAKGLEAPVVILPVTVNKARAKTDIIWWAGESPQDWVILAEPAGTQSHAIAALKKEKEQAAQQEDQRLLYVAMTRAEDELHVCGYSTLKEDPPDSWYEQVRAGMNALEGLQTLSDGRLRVACEQTAAVAAHPSVSSVTTAAALPEWIHQPARKETKPKLWTPSQLPVEAGSQHHDSAEDAAESARLRGTALHRLLEWLPPLQVNVTQTDLLACAQRLLAGQEALNIEELVQEVWRIRESEACSCIFLQQAQAEVSIVGNLRAADGSVKAFSGQIDRLLVTDSEVHIIDFKSNRRIPASVQDVPLAYIHQLWVYRALLSQTFPQHHMRASLLWTRQPLLMTLPTDVLDNYGVRALDSWATCA